MYVRERPGSLRGGETGHDDVRTRAREEESSSGGAETDSGERERVEARRGRRGSMRRRQEVAEVPSLLTLAVGSVIKLVCFAEFEILFVSFFVLAVLLFKDLTARPEYNQILVHRQFEEQTRLY
ncbi:hypothetical protein M758_5G032800 [Ceratodon purpureus]|uniref:Uncharacterized protein n=1 Tax=Ceratodon purpureus TaxID=3225 RepID=A0A8T0HYT3_CERPU|nr:hypothetical protein KC19_5G030800 [Ceratodon purpureus]KAG0615334.1 hypothetical protein M758_5G032800 [Ceratodon purpureus]